VKGALCPVNANRLYTDEYSMEKGKIIKKDNTKVKGRKKVKRKKRLCCYFV